MRTLFSRSATLVAAGALAFAGACKEATSVPDLNNLPSSTIANGLTPTTFQLLVTGLVNQDRANFGFRYIVFTETMARDVYNLDPSESRFITELLGGSAIDPGGFTGAGNFLGFYNALATANTILAGLPGLQANYGFTAQQVSATSGFVRTYRALELYRAFATRGANGIPADAATSVSGTLPPVLCQTSALARISALLDSANTDLQAAGNLSAFPFQLPSGFSSNGNFATPAKFAQFNRGLKGKVEVYRGILAQNGDVTSAAGAPYFTNAVAALNASFLNATGDLSTGVYYTFSAAPNEQTNPIAATTIYLNPSVETVDTTASATVRAFAATQVLQPGDLRASKIVTLSKPRTLNRVSTTYTSTLSAPSNQTGSIPLLTNAELVLLRAQAEIGLGNLAAATADINAVHTSTAVTTPQLGGGLPAYPTFTSAVDARNAVLYEKRFALLLTGAQRLVDLRSYNLLNGTYFKKEIAADAFNAAVPLPKQETDARGGNVTLTCS